MKCVCMCVCLCIWGEGGGGPGQCEQRDGYTVQPAVSDLSDD